MSSHVRVSLPGGPAGVAGGLGRRVPRRSHHPSSMPVEGTRPDGPEVRPPVPSIDRLHSHRLAPQHFALFPEGPFEDGTRQFVPRPVQALAAEQVSGAGVADREGIAARPVSREELSLEAGTPDGVGADGMGLGPRLGRNTAALLAGDDPAVILEALPEGALGCGRRRASPPAWTAPSSRRALPCWAWNSPRSSRKSSPPCGPSPRNWGWRGQRQHSRDATEALPTSPVCPCLLGLRAG